MLHMDIGTADDGFSRRTKLWGGRWDRYFVGKSKARPAGALTILQKDVDLL